MQPGNFPELRNMTQAEAFAWAMAPTPGIRLTLTQGTPITTADVTGATSIYAEPYNGAVVPLFRDAAGKYPAIRKLSASTLSLALGTLASATIPNDVFAYDNAGAVGLEKLAWTNATTRATAVDLVNGRYYKNGDYSRLLVGGFYPTATTTTQDSAGGVTTQVGGKRFLWNAFNRVTRAIKVIDTTGTWSYTTNTVRQANAASGNKVEYFCGIAEDNVFADVRGSISVDSNTAVAAKVGLGVDATNAFSGVSSSAFNFGLSALYAAFSGLYGGIPGLGYHYIAWCEVGASNGNSIFVGNNAGEQSGLIAQVRA